MADTDTPDRSRNVTTGPGRVEAVQGRAETICQNFRVVRDTEGTLDIGCTAGAPTSMIGTLS